MVSTIRDGVHEKQQEGFMAAGSVGLALQIRGMEMHRYASVLAARESV